MKSKTDERLHTGQKLLSDGKWEEARAAFEEACLEAPAPEVLEGLSWACWWLSDAEATIDAREHAYRLYRKRGDAQDAARMAIWLSSDYLEFRGEAAIANGWKQRARRLLEGFDTVPEHGWLLLLEGAGALEMYQDTVKAVRLGAQAAEIGRRLGVIDLEAIGLAVQGLARVNEGDGESGASLLDEAMTVAVGGEIEQPLSLSWVGCYLIDACERMRDVDRAAQWCRKLEAAARRWRFRFGIGVCRTHYAGVLTWRGQWAEAEAELVESTRDLQKTRPPYAVEGIVRLAELRRRQGRLDEARTLFEQADGHPFALLGNAEVALDLGDPGEAEELLQRYLRQTPEPNRMRHASGHELLVRTYAALGDVSRASSSLRELRSIATAVGTPALTAAAAFAEALVAVAAADYQTASYRLEDAADRFQRCGAPYEAGRSRVELASVLFALGRTDAARKVARAALDGLRHVGAHREAERAAALLERLAVLEADGRLTAASGGEDAAPRVDRSAGDGDATGRAGGSAPDVTPFLDLPNPLTPRETEVLRLVAVGRSDREIATELYISEHTVHRHISNIRAKLDVPSRAAAAVFAARHQLI